MMRSKLIAFYISSFIAIFIILFSLNFLYKRVIMDFSIGNKYTVTAQQYFNFKSNSLDNLFNKLFSKGQKVSKKKLKQEYQIKYLAIENFTLTLESPKTSIEFELTSKEYFDENDLENKINNLYIGSIKNIIKNIENKRELYDYELILRKFIENKNTEIVTSYKNLINSDFFQNYPPKETCRYNDTEVCYYIYAKYYTSVFFSLRDKEISMSLLNDLNIIDEEIKEQRIVEILKDFESNRYLYDNFYIQNLSSDDPDEIEYFSNKYNELINSNFFSKYVPESFCQYYSAICYKELSSHFNSILSKHKLESELFFDVKYIPPNSTFNLIIEAPLIFGLSAVITYYFFIFTNKFFRRKLK